MTNKSNGYNNKQKRIEHSAKLEEDRQLMKKENNVQEQPIISMPLKEDSNMKTTYEITEEHKSLARQLLYGRGYLKIQD